MSSKLSLDRVLQIISMYVKYLSPRFSEWFNSLIKYSTHEEAEQAPVEALVRNFTAYRECSIVVLEKDNMLYPVIKPGTFMGSEDLKIPHEYCVLLDLHIHPEPIYVPSKGDIDALIHRYREGATPQYYGVASIYDDLVLVSQIHCTQDLKDKLEDVSDEFKRIECEFKEKSRPVAYVPLPCLVTDFSSCRLSDEELIALSRKYVEQAIQLVGSDVYRVLDYILAKYIDVVHELETTLEPEKVLGIYVMEVYSREYLEELCDRLSKVLKQKLSERYSIYRLPCSLL